MLATIALKEILKTHITKAEQKINSRNLKPRRHFAYNSNLAEIRNHQLMLMNDQILDLVSVM